MALTKVNRGGLNTGISDSSDATFLTVSSAEVATFLTSAVVTSENGGTTTNICEGLIKAFMRNTAAQNAVVKSFNQSSFTDVATGRMTITFTNNMQDAVFLGNATTLTSVDRNSVCQSFATTSMDMHTFSDSLSQTNNSTDTIQNCIVNGDLA
tara:strand:+ start:42 stop:500 length:459 start_codon:yes stop_codon:yes gene_type:complete